MITERINNILKELEDSKVDAEKAESGNASAGRRVRKAAMAAIKELKELRALILQNSKK